MARIRSIKPEFFVSEQIADVSPTCRLLFIGLWVYCDDAGVHPASPRQLKMEVFPGDDITTQQVADMVYELLRVGLLIEYESNDDSDGMQVRTYWQVTGWHHQKIERPRYQYPQPDAATLRRCVADVSPIHRSPRVRAGSETIGDETIGDDRIHTTTAEPVVVASPRSFGGSGSSIPGRCKKARPSRHTRLRFVEPTPRRFWLPAWRFLPQTKLVASSARIRRRG